MKISLGHLTAASFVILLAACGDANMDADTDEIGIGADTMTAEADTAASQTVVVDLEPTEGNDVQGTVTLTDRGTGIHVAADLTGLAEGEHGFHIHENGDCSAPDASSAGGHFDPAGNPHGGPEDRPDQAHMGDMGNLTADASGAASYEREFSNMAFDGEGGIAGRAIVVHAGADDLESQPSGDAGDRVACGVIEADS